MKKKILIVICIAVAIALFITKSNMEHQKNLNSTYSIVTEVFDYGQQVSKIVIEFKTEIDGNSFNKQSFSIISENSLNGRKYDNFNHEIIDIYLSDKFLGEKNKTGKFMIIELANDISLPLANTLFWNRSICSNEQIILNYTIINNKSLKTKKGKTLEKEKLKISYKDRIDLLVEKFKSSEKKDDLNYRYYVPKKDDKKNPLIIWLHGAGEGGVSNYTQIAANKGGVGFITDEAQKIFDGAYVLVPQAATFWVPYYKVGDHELIGKDYTKDLIILIKEFIKNNPDVDANRIYIGGASGGGYQVLKTIIEDPDLFAAAFPTCAAYEPTNDELERLKNLPIWFTHAKIDGTVSSKLSENSYNYLKSIGNKNVFYSEYPNVKYDGIEYWPHMSWVYVLNNDPRNENKENLFNWLAKQKK